MLLKDNVPATKFSDKWLGPYTVLRVNKNGVYHLTGKNGLRLKCAVNGDRMKPLDNSASHLVPDVLTSSAQ